MLQNSLFIIGNLTKDPKECAGRSGKAFTAFDIAVNMGAGENNKTLFVSARAFDRTGETVLKYGQKGRKIAVRGEASVRAWLGNDGQPRATLEILAREVQFLNAATMATGEDAPAPAPIENADDLPW